MNQGGGMTTTKIIIGGDVCPVNRDKPLFMAGKARELFSGLLEEFIAADWVVVNLETPLIDVASPIKKSGSVFGVPGDCISGLKSAGIDMVNLANNHIMDHGEEGLKNTMDVCAKNGMLTIGAGVDIFHASQPQIVELNETRIAFLGCAEHEFSIASEEHAGANPLDPWDFQRLIRERKGRWDYLVVMLHSGKEHYPFPTPNQQKFCRALIDNGACAVICQHSHIAGAYEEYHGGFISYGQGNLLFDPFPDKRPWLYDGCMIELAFEKTSRIKYRLIPHTQSDISHGMSLGVRMKTKDLASIFLENLQTLSQKLTIPGFVLDKWSEFCETKRQSYFSILRGHGKLARKINNVLKIANLCYSQNDLLTIQNIIRCETHREVLETLLENSMRPFGRKETDS